VCGAIWRRSPAHSPPAENRANLLSGQRILVVDDNRTNRRLLELLLAHRGSDSFMAEGGADALVLLRAELATGSTVDATKVIRALPG